MTQARHLCTRYSYLHSVRPPTDFYALRGFGPRLCRMDAGNHEVGGLVSWGRHGVSGVIMHSFE